MEKYSSNDIRNLKKFDMECCSIDCIKYAIQKNTLLSHLDDFLFNMKVDSVTTHGDVTKVMSMHRFVIEFFDFMRNNRPYIYSDLPNEVIYQKLTNVPSNNIDEEFIRCSLYQLIKSEYSEVINWYIDDYDWIIAINFNKYMPNRYFYDIEITQNFEPSRSRHVYITCSNKNQFTDMNEVVNIAISKGLFAKEEVDLPCSIKSITEPEYLIHMKEEYEKTKLEESEGCYCGNKEEENMSDGDELDAAIAVFSVLDKEDLDDVYDGNNILSTELYKYLVNTKMDHTNENVTMLFIIGRNPDTFPEPLANIDLDEIILNISKDITGYDGYINKVTKISKYLSRQSVGSDKYSAKYFVGIGCNPNDECETSDDIECCSDFCEEDCKCRNMEDKDCCESCDVREDCGCSQYCITDNCDTRYCTLYIDNTSSDSQEPTKPENIKHDESGVDKTIKIPIIPVDPKAEILTLSRLIGDRLRYLMGNELSEVKVTAICNFNENSPTGYDQHLSISSNAEMDL